MRGGNRAVDHLKRVTVAVVAVTLIGVFLALSTIGVLGAPRGLGRVRGVNVGVFSDSGCTVACTSINWGSVNSGGVASRTVYVKNLGVDAVTLYLSSSNWSPKVAASLVKLSWDLGRPLLSAGEVVPAVLTLELASDTGNLRDFSFVVVITGVQQRS